MGHYCQYMYYAGVFHGVLCCISMFGDLARFAQGLHSYGDLFDVVSFVEFPFGGGILVLVVLFVVVAFVDCPIGGGILVQMVSGMLKGCCMFDSYGGVLVLVPF